ncbi:MAG: 3'(2'),5'-bisphosphate nucleotidase CysQ [Bacteroidota bacterium]
MVDLRKLLEFAKRAALEAAKEILVVYESDDFDIERKGDQSPLTKADKVSHKVICNILEQTGIPILSEEGRDIPFETRRQWEYFWLVDPIDGTKEFIKRNGEFTVNIALIHRNEPVLGVVQVPVSGDMYTAVKGHGAFKDGERIFVNKCEMEDPGLRVVASRSHLNDDTRQFIEQINDPVIVSKGSSLKLLLVASGEADLYPRFAPTMEWDTAAAQIVVTEAGGSVLIRETQDEVHYNKENLLNPHFLVTAELVGNE